MAKKGLAGVPIAPLIYMLFRLYATIEVYLPEVQGKDVTEKDPQIDKATFELGTFCDKMGLKLESPELLKDINSSANVSFDIASFRYTGFHRIQILWPAARLEEEIKMQTVKEGNRSP